MLQYPVMTSDEGLIVIPSILGKRKVALPIVAETTEKKHKCAVMHPLIKDKFEDYAGDACWPILQASKAAEMALKEAGRGWLLHISKLDGITTQATLNAILSRINTHYEIQQVTYGIALKFIDIRFGVVKPTDRRTGELSNVMKLDHCDPPTDALSKVVERIGSKIENADCLLLARLISHAENVKCKDTPEDLKIQVETINGFTLLCTGEEAKENKTKRDTHEFTVKGYDELSKAEFDSFAHILPFHVHSPAIDWDNGAISVQVQSYQNPRIGHPVDLYMDMATAS